MRVGIEVGGTFTDLVAVDGDRIDIIKVPSTPQSPDIGALASLRAAGIDLSRVADLVHGSTVATNAVLERKGAHVAFVTTAGFRDILMIQRHDRRAVYDLQYRKPRAVVRRRDCFEIGERMGADGRAIAPLDEEAVVAILVPQLQRGQYGAIAICLLGAYANPAHEERLRALLARHLQSVFITCSSDVIREFREYERASTTALAAYVQPVIDRYLDRLSGALREGGFSGRFSVMQSNGGRLPATGIQRNAITALFSGPAAGVVGAIRQAGRSGFANLVTFDMGGTSTDVCLVADGHANVAAETEIDGLPIRTPVLDIVTVGAGGGSIVWIDDGGMLRVGPESAGADPGPACYGLGGRRPTLTDAHLLRGTIRAEGFLGGGMRIDKDAAQTVFRALAEQFGGSPEDLAASAIRLANANIVRAIQLVSTQRGRDPRDYALVPFGGAGPLVAAQIAEDLGIDTIVVPPNPGVMSAYGLLAADDTKVESVTRRAAVDGDAPELVRRSFAEMRDRLHGQFRELGLDGPFALAFSIDMRFIGQAFEVTVALPIEALATLSTATLLDAFAAEHQRVFFHGAASDRKVEIVAFRLAMARPLEKLPMFRERRGAAMPAQRIRVLETAGALDCALIPSASLVVGRPIDGPALVEGYSSSTYIPPGWRGALDASDNLVVRRMRPQETKP
jgi:N-methylhydantoinase A